MQFMESLTDREALDAVRSRIDGKYLLGLELSGADFHYQDPFQFPILLLLLVH